MIAPAGQISAQAVIPFFSRLVFLHRSHLTICGMRLVPLELGDVEGAGHLAVAAADAGVLVVIDDAGDLVRGHGADRADRDAGRLLAMHAGVLDVGPLLVRLLEELDQGAGAAGQILRGVPEAVLVECGLLVGEAAVIAVDPLAGRHAGLAADALGGVVEHAERLVVDPVRPRTPLPHPARPAGPPRWHP